MIRPTPAGGVGAPAPFNSNDALVWKALICKYLCKYRIETFNDEEFYKTFLEGKLDAGDAYLQPLQSGSNEDRRLFDRLLHFCLESLTEIGLLTKSVKSTGEIAFNKAPRLDIFCEDMLKYAVFDVNWMVEPVRQAKAEILNDQNRSEIIEFLEELKKVYSIDASEVGGRIDLSSIQKLSQLGLILTLLEGSIMITPIGTKFLLDLKKGLKI